MGALVLDSLVDIDAVVYQVASTTVNTTPTLLTFLNPGQFKILDTLTDKQKRIEKIEHDQKMEQYLITHHMYKVLVMLFKEIFNKLLWTDLTLKRSSTKSAH